MLNEYVLDSLLDCNFITFPETSEVRLYNFQTSNYISY